MWFDLEDISDALRTLKKLHDEVSESVGNFFVEIYPSKVSFGC